MSKRPRTVKKQAVTSQDAQIGFNPTRRSSRSCVSPGMTKNTFFRERAAYILTCRFPEAGDINWQSATQDDFSAREVLRVERGLERLQRSYTGHHDASESELSPKRAFT